MHRCHSHITLHILSIIFSTHHHSTYQRSHPYHTPTHTLAYACNTHSDCSHSRPNPRQHTLHALLPLSYHSPPTLNHLHNSPPLHHATLTHTLTRLYHHQLTHSLTHNSPRSLSLLLILLTYTYDALPPRLYHPPLALDHFDITHICTRTRTHTWLLHHHRHTHTRPLTYQPDHSYSCSHDYHTHTYDLYQLLKHHIPTTRKHYHLPALLHLTTCITSLRTSYTTMPTHLLTHATLKSLALRLT
jgi:hypothetical protein